METEEVKMPKYKVKITIGEYEEVVEAKDSRDAENLAEERFLQHLSNDDVNLVSVQEV